MPELETVDLEAVEILATGGPVFGVGSPPEGDFWTSEELAAIAAADRELEGELLPPVKIGHSDAQALALNSGVGQPTAGEMPACGWVENLRVSDDGQKLLADLKAVPRRLAELIEAGAYRTRSVELSKVTSQKTGKVFEWVVTGLAWLGGKMPAVRTLDDVVALYEHAGEAPDTDANVSLRKIVEYASGKLVWEPGDGFLAIRAAVQEAINGGPSAGLTEERFYVRDVADGRALVVDWYDSSEERAWIVPFTRTRNGVRVSPSAEWTSAAMAWVKDSRDFEDQLMTLRARRADIRASVPEKTYTDEQRRAFAEATGLDQAKVTDAMLDKAGVAEAPTGDPDPDPKRDLEADERLRSLEQRATEADERSRKLEEELRVERRAAFVEQVLRDGKAEPGQRAQIEKMYDTSPDVAREFFQNAPVHEELRETYGADDGDPKPEDEADAEKAYESEHERIFGAKPTIGSVS